MQDEKVLVLGGYGGVGKSLCHNLLRYTDCQLGIGGRNAAQAKELIIRLQNEFPGARVDYIPLDAKKRDSLIEPFKWADLVIVAATVPDLMENIAHAAVNGKTHLIDILVRGDVAGILRKYNGEFLDNQRFCITQAGFHPGIIAPLIRLPKTYFDSYEEANVGLAMDAVFGKPQSTYEIIHEVVEGNPKTFENGVWQKATYRDSKSFQFDSFGRKMCFPMKMQEVYGLEKELGLGRIGVYASGFSSFIDNFVFPLAVFLGKLSKKISQQLCGWLLFKSANNTVGDEAKAEIKLQAKGKVKGRPENYEVSVFAKNSFDLTALCVVACLKQVFNTPGLHGVHLMGNVVDEQRLFKDLTDFGIEIGHNI